MVNRLGRWYTNGARRQENLGYERLEDRTLLTGAPPTVVDLHVAGTEWTPAFYSYLASHGQGDLGYRIPAGVSQTKSLPWFNIDKVVVTFSEDVNVDAADLAISGVNAPSLSYAHFFYDATSHVATWTLAGPLPKNVYQFDLDANGVDAIDDRDGNPLDGEWTNSSDTFPSGNGSAGGDFQFTFKVMPGDAVQNNAVDYYDYYAASSRQGLTTASTNYSPLVDIDGSGVHETQDTQDIYSKLWSTYPSGSPVGVSNDAPTTTGGETITLTNAAADAVMSLWNAFGDAETPDNQLTYQILSVSNPSLLDVAAINSTSGNLVLNAAAGQSGRAEILVKATDAVGQSVFATFFVDVFYENQPPILDFIAVNEGYNTWRIVGSVGDADDGVEGLLVTFAGAVDARCTVQADGSFEFSVVVEEEDWGLTSGIVYDRHGLGSGMIVRQVSIT
jgi:hypothetical protein